MKIDVRIIPIFSLMFVLLVDMGCLIKMIPPFEVYGGPIKFLIIHGICGLASGMSIGSVIKEGRNE